MSGEKNLFYQGFPCKSFAVPSRRPITLHTSGQVKRLEPELPSPWRKMPGSCWQCAHVYRHHHLNPQPTTYTANITRMSENTQETGLKTLPVIRNCSDLGPFHIWIQKKQVGKEILCFSLAFRQMLETLQLDKCYI